ncbi:hypothetical protein [Caudoviricetes sp.]|nr:hypothetical protein [Caudoviricetes sp.]UOF82769.1 hypothetical protein [Caudoviricetes sp.]
MAQQNVKTAPKQTNKAEKPAPEPRVDTRVAYVESDEAKSIVNADGKLTAAPIGYDYRKHKAPKRVDFADEADFYEFKAQVYDVNAERFAKRAVSCRENAATMRKFGDPAQRALVRRRQKLQELMAELDAQLAADGISLDEIA